MTRTQTDPSNGVASSWRSRWRHHAWAVVKIVVALGAVATAVYWLRFSPALVTGFTVKRGLVIAEVMGTGTLEARVSATVSPKISGRIVELLVDQGDRVTAGQILFRLDDSDLKRQVEMAQSALAAAQAGVARQEAEVASAQAVLDKAHYDFDRVRGLLERDTASITEFQDATKMLRVAEADLKRSDAALAEARSQVTMAERTLGYHEARLADTVIAAPFDGLIARRDRDPGVVVVPSASVLLVLNTAEMWVSAWVDETEMARLRPDQPARVVFRSEPDKSYPGHVVRLGREADRETREFVVDVQSEALPANWAVGQRAEVYIETERKADALLLPASLVIFREGHFGAFIEEYERAAWRPLQLGLRGREVVEVTGGLKSGDRVIAPVNRQAGALKVGRRVAIELVPAHGVAGERK
jgi:HlyD family secretion protein